MKIAIIGYSGMLGSDVLYLLRDAGKSSNKDLSLVCVNSKDLNISDKALTSSFFLNHKPDIVINCAAYTDVDGCEENRDMAFSVNAEGVKNIALAAKQYKSKVVQVSTDYVFDGLDNNHYTEESPANPLSVYGKSKLKGEEYLREILDDYLIIRTAWLYGIHGKNHYVKNMLRLGSENNRIKVVNDQIGSPTNTKDLAKAILLLLRCGYSGIFNVTNRGSCSRYEWSKKIFELAGYNTDVQPISSVEFKRPATVPAHAILDCKKFNTVTGHEMKNWDDALRDYFVLLQTGL